VESQTHISLAAFSTIARLVLTYFDSLPLRRHSTMTTATKTTTTTTTIQVRAPSDLPAGSVFLAALLGEGDDDEAKEAAEEREQSVLKTQSPRLLFRITVPEGGIAQGQTLKFRVDGSPCGDDDDDEEDLSSMSSSSSSSPSSHCSSNSWAGARTGIKRKASISSSSSNTTASTSPAIDYNNHGRWKDGIFDCFRHGYLHPALCNAWCCPHVLLTQLMTRMRMSWISVFPSDKDEDGKKRKRSNKRMLALFLLATMFDFCFLAPLVEFSSASSSSRQLLLLAAGVSGGEGEAAGQYYRRPQQQGGPMMLNNHFYWTLLLELFYFLWSTALGLYAVLSIARLRAAVRRKYHIPPSSGWRGCCAASRNGYVAEDIWCVVCCNCCTLAQLARQTADYDSGGEDGDENRVKASCCTQTGLSNSERLHVCAMV